jgi:hypothetical protein
MDQTQTDYKNIVKDRFYQLRSSFYNQRSALPLWAREMEIILDAISTLESPQKEQTFVKLILDKNNITFKKVA